MVDTNDLTVRVKSVVEKLDGLEVKTQEAYDQATDFLKKIKESKAFIEKAFEEDRVAAKAVYDEVLEKKRNYVKPMDEADKIVRSKMSVYATKVEAERRERERLERERLLKESEEQALRKAEEQVAMGRVKEANKTIETSGSIPMSWGREQKSIKTVTVWDLQVTNVAAFIEYMLLEHGSLLPSISVDRAKLVTILKSEKFGVEGCNIPGITINLVSRPSL
jgi:hypothetical protein